MARSLGLAAYRALVRREPAQIDVPQIPRPAGELVWIHVGEPANLLAVQDLALRLINVRPDLTVLLTLPEDEGVGTPPPARSDAALIQISVPSEHPASVKAFLDQWVPDTCIWVWGGLRPNLMIETAQRRHPMFLIDADVRGFDKPRDRWLPDLTRQLVTQFTAAFARSAEGYKRLIQMGVPSQKAEQTSPLLAGGQVLPCADSDLTEMSAVMRGRPAWFATEVMANEVSTVLAAHKQALRLSHRLLLILHPKASDDLDQIAEQAAERDLTTIRWDDGQFPDDTTQLMISTDAVDRGLFYRVAPVSFLGTTLFPGEGGCDPLEAAALGSAILYGPKVRHFMPSYSRLATAGAARIVNDAGALSTAVSRLIAPDQAATMAHAGWDVISQGAALTDKVIDMVQNALDLELSRP